MIFLLILIFFCLILILLSAKCVELVVKPYRYTEEEMRKEEIEHGFLSSIEAYEKEWEREPFELISNGVTLSGEIIKNPKGKDKVAIVCHGHTVNRYASIKYADMFYQRGFHVVINDAYGIIGLNSKDSADKGFLKLSPILFSPQKRLMVDLRRKNAQNEDLSAKRSAACNSGSTVSDVVPSRLLQRQSAEHTPDVDLHRSTVRYPKDVSLACAA